MNIKIKGIQEATSEKIFPVTEETFGVHGHCHTRWIMKHVYWVLPLGTTLLMLLILLAFGVIGADSDATSNLSTPSASTSVVKVEIPGLDKLDKAATEISSAASKLKSLPAPRPQLPAKQVVLAPTSIPSRPADPTIGMTPMEKRQYEIWVLRK